MDGSGAAPKPPFEDSTVGVRSGPLGRHYELIEAGEEYGSVRLAHRGRPTAALARRAQRGHQIAGRQRVADRLRVEDPATRRDHPRPPVDAARGERQIPGHHDVAWTRMLGDPLIGLVAAPTDDDEPSNHAEDRVQIGNNRGGFNGWITR